MEDRADEVMVAYDSLPRVPRTPPRAFVNMLM